MSGPAAEPPGGAGARRAEKPGRVSAREPPGKRRRNWARRAVARPRASCGSGSSEGGGAGPLPQSWGRLKSPGNGACGVPGGGALPAATPPRSPGSGPPSRERSAFLLCEEHPRRPDHGLRGRGEGRRSVRYPVPQPQAPRSRKRGGKDSGLLTQTSEGRSARRGVWLPSGDPRAHYGWPCVAKFKLSLRECLPGQRNTASSGHSAKRRGGDLRAEERRPSWERDGRAGGVPWARQAAEASGKVLLAARGVVPRAGAAQVHVGPVQASAKSPRPKRTPSPALAAAGEPLLGGVSAGGGGRGRGGPSGEMPASPRCQAARCAQAAGQSSARCVRSPERPGG
ncbi:spidroin-2-like [Nomascus leucogenys]|uniref:spidroin-2-like n=1 Tax=Nomascus leucogenys TaxID=61853 RepID=UPI00122D5492|nr:spidroin-2-like [Nomascus leucogenys]